MPTQFKNHSIMKNSKKFHNFYGNRFIGMKCAPDMLKVGLYPNLKEITESFAAFEATLHLEYEYNDPNVNVVCVGDGVSPRTAAMFAYRSKWTVCSVDPSLRNKSWNIHRYTGYTAKIEDVSLNFDTPTLIVCVHSHAKLTNCLNSIKAPIRHVINIPCCVKPDIGKPFFSYEDIHIHSPMNRVEIYHV
jgi:hypothetical protein